jgi:hypothetical protein
MFSLRTAIEGVCVLASVGMNFVDQRRIVTSIDSRAKLAPMGFNRRKMDDERRTAAEQEAAARRACVGQVLEDAVALVAAWNERQTKRMPMLFSPTIGAAIAARHWFLWVQCPACRTTQAIDLRKLDRHHDTALTGLIPALSCRSCRPHAPFAELVMLWPKSIADEMLEEHTRHVLGESP